jgi:hypothetical protein
MRNFQFFTAIASPLENKYEPAVQGENMRNMTSVMQGIKIYLQVFPSGSFL